MRVKHIKILSKYKVPVTKIYNLSHDQYLERLESINSVIFPLEQYINQDTKIKHKCKLCGEEFEYKPLYAMKGRAGHKCSKIKKVGNRQKTTEQYISDLQEQFPNLVPIEDYIDAKTSIEHKCLVCGNIFNRSPNNILSKGRGCSKCLNKVMGQARIIPVEIMLERIEQINPTVKMIGEYINATTPTTFLCLICGHEWPAEPDNVTLKKHPTGCPKCAIKKNAQKLICPKDKYLEELAEYNPNIELIGEYISKSTPALHRCKICGHEWWPEPSNLTGHSGCPECGKEIVRNSKIKTHSKFLEEIKDAKHESVTLIDEYTGCDIKLRCKCGICGLDFYIFPAKIREGHYHYECELEEIRQSKLLPMEEFLSRIPSSIQVLSDYQGYGKSVDCQCKECGYLFPTTPALLALGYGCRECADKSLGEQKVLDYLIEHNIRYTLQKKFKGLVGEGNKALSYDFFLPELRTLVEVNGKQHYQPIEYYGGEAKFRQQQEHDRRKKQYALDNNYSLLEIKYNQIKKIDEILNNYLNSLSVETTGYTG